MICKMEDFNLEKVLRGGGGGVSEVKTCSLWCQKLLIGCLFLTQTWWENVAGQSRPYFGLCWNPPESIIRLGKISGYLDDFKK